MGSKKKSKLKTWVKGHTRKDGTRVRGHWRYKSAYLRAHGASKSQTRHHRY